MADSSVCETTQPLRACAEGDERARDVLIPRVYRELRRLEGHCLKNEQPEQTLPVSDLVHDAYLRLANLSRLDWQHRNQFFAVSATLMRRILVDGARRWMAAKRGERAQGKYVQRALDVSSKRPAETVALDDALNELARLAPRKANIIDLRFLDLRFFEGPGVAETAGVAGVSSDTVVRRLRLSADRTGK